MVDFVPGVPDVGTGPAGTDGDDNRSAWTKAISNFAQLFAAFVFDSTSNAVELTKSLWSTNATGGDQGADTINVVALHVNGVKWSSGTGTPEAVVTGTKGDMFSRTDGGAGTCFYIKESDTTNVGWVAK